MNPVIEDIIKRKCSNEDKNKILKSLSEDIEIAKKIISGEFKYCTKCSDYYFAQSFFLEKEVKEEDICTYVDPINSSGNEYKKGKVEYTYLICPKGHKHTISKKEL